MANPKQDPRPEPPPPADIPNPVPPPQDPEPVEMVKSAIKGKLPKNTGIPNVSRPIFSDILSEDDQKALRGQALAKIEADRRQQAADAFLAAAIEELKMKQGMHTGGPLDEIVDITIILPEPHVVPSLLVNGQHYWHGQTYQVERHRANSFKEMMQRQEQYVSREIDGKLLVEYYRKSSGVPAHGGSAQGRF